MAQTQGWRVPGPSVKRTRSSRRSLKVSASQQPLRHPPLNRRLVPPTACERMSAGPPRRLRRGGTCQGTARPAPRRAAPTTSARAASRAGPSLRRTRRAASHAELPARGARPRHRALRKHARTHRCRSASARGDRGAGTGPLCGVAGVVTARGRPQAGGSARANSKCPCQWGGHAGRLQPNAARARARVCVCARARAVVWEGAGEGLQRTVEGLRSHLTVKSVDVTPEPDVQQGDSRSAAAVALSTARCQGARIPVG